MKHDAEAVRALILRARQGDQEALGQLLESHREDLRRWAERRLPGRVGARVGGSDVVQQTFLEAHRNFGQFFGGDEPELVAWLQRILECNVAEVIRDHTQAQKRDVRRERPLAGGPGSEEARPTEPPARHSTPSQRAVRGEEEESLARALAALPEDQREAVRLRHLEGRPLKEIARLLGRSETATAGLIKRGMQALRRLLGEADEEGS
jgi:RNA polymerase sigma-70 factor (ECF subfamily)